MANKKEKIQSGIFKAERIFFNLKNGTQEELKETIKTIFQNIGLEPMLKGYEAQAEKILEDNGYPTTLDELWTYDDKDLPPQIQDLKKMLLRIEEVRNHVKKNKAEDAAWNALLLANAAMRANIRPIEADVFRGAKVLDGAKKSGQGRRDQIKAEKKPEWKNWQELANEIWNKFPSYSKLRVAKDVGKVVRINYETIRKRIKKLS